MWMTMSESSASPSQTDEARESLRCLRCEYPLRALRVRRNRIRCPECGSRYDLDRIAYQIVDRRRRRRQADLDLTGFLLVAGVAAAVYAFGTDGVVERQIDTLFTGIGLLLGAIGVVIAMLAVLSIAPELFWWERLLLVIVGATLMVLTPFPGSLLVAGTWCFVFWWRIVRE
jgi:DNA-directed RNA polymerase subunit RPC12/RpoP